MRIGDLILKSKEDTNPLNRLKITNENGAKEIQWYQTLEKECRDAESQVENARRLADRLQNNEITALSNMSNPKLIEDVYIRSRNFLNKMKQGQYSSIAPIRVEKPIRIVTVMPLSSKKTNWVTIHDMAFWKIFVPSYLKYTDFDDVRYHHSLYVGYDSGDYILDKEENVKEMRSTFYDAVSTDKVPIRLTTVTSQSQDISIR